MLLSLSSHLYCLPVTGSQETVSLSRMQLWTFFMVFIFIRSFYWDFFRLQRWNNFMLTVIFFMRNERASYLILLLLHKNFDSGAWLKSSHATQLRVPLPWSLCAILCVCVWALSHSPGTWPRCFPSPVWPSDKVVTWPLCYPAFAQS